MPKKWYVVTVGRSVGVFTSWLEVSPLVNGVSGARHQSFPTKEEAIQAFADEISKGQVKVVDWVSSAPSSTQSTPRSIASSASPPRRSHSHVISSPAVSNGRPVRRSNSELSYVGDTAGTRRDNYHQGRMSTSSESSRRRSPSHLSPIATVRSPSDQGYYPMSVSSAKSPKSAGMLTPRSGYREEGRNSGTPSTARSTPGRRHYASVSIAVPVCDHCVMTMQRKCVHCSRSIGDSPGDSLSNAFSQMHVSHHAVYGREIDPRSPVPCKSSIPASVNAISFGRPSPGRSPLPEAGSVLFRRN